MRIFFAHGDPNLTSNFHPIGNVWSKAWREGAIASTPERYVQTVAVPPGKLRHLRGGACWFLARLRSSTTP